MALPLAERGEVDAARVGDELVVTVAGHRRVLTLPSVLRRCAVAGGAFDGLRAHREVRARSVTLRRPDAPFRPRSDVVPGAAGRPRARGRGTR